MYGEESSICKEAVEVFGRDTQTLMFVEEVGELLQALSKEKRGLPANIPEEIADVEIMLEQLKHIYRCHSETNKHKNRKIIRLYSRVEVAKRGG